MLIKEQYVLKILSTPVIHVDSMRAEFFSIMFYKWIHVIKLIDKQISDFARSPRAVYYGLPRQHTAEDCGTAWTAGKIQKWSTG